jgi:hypothetical protein
MPYAASPGKAFHSKGAGEFAHDSLRLGAAAIVRQAFLVANPIVI